jgi:hypothetical protein
MSVNPASNFANLTALSAEVLAYNFSNGTVNDTVQNLMQKFLTSLSETHHTILVNALKAALDAKATGNNATLRLLLAIDDGTVAYDSGKSVADNSFANFGLGQINSSNHNTRPEILIAILGNSGTAVSSRYSKSASTFQKYYAQRLGVGANSNLGTFRVSMNDTI